MPPTASQIGPYPIEHIPKKLPLQFKSPALVVNMDAGSTRDISEDASKIFQRFSHGQLKTHLSSAQELQDHLRMTAQDGTDLLVIYGGDGTCKSGALAAKTAEIPIIPLLGGTMNMLPKSLYGTDDWEKALEIALSQPSPRWQSAGIINKKMFFCGAILGEPILMSEARESLRGGDISDAVKQVPEILNAISHGEEFEYRADGKIIEKAANTLQIACPYMSSGAVHPTKFELASAPQLSIGQMLEIGAKAITDDWRTSQSVSITLAEDISITGQGGFDVLLDGELESVSCPINIRLQINAVKVMAPKLGANEKAKL